MTPWQSDVLALVQLAFALALVPTLLNRRARVPRTSSLVTAAGLYAVATVYVTLELWSAVAMATVSAAAWTFIAVRRALVVVKLEEPPVVFPKGRPPCSTKIDHNFPRMGRKVRCLWCGRRAGDILEEVWF